MICIKGWCQNIQKTFSKTLYQAQCFMSWFILKTKELTAIWNYVCRMCYFIPITPYLIPGWLAVMAACVLYNAWVIPFRYIFCEYQTDQNWHIWFIIDYCVVDMLYLMDILAFKYRLLYMENGFWVKVGIKYPPQSRW